MRERLTKCNVIIHKTQPSALRSRSESPADVDSSSQSPAPGNFLAPPDPSESPAHVAAQGGDPADLDTELESHMASLRASRQFQGQQLSQTQQAQQGLLFAGVELSDGPLSSAQRQTSSHSRSHSHSEVASEAQLQRLQLLLLLLLRVSPRRLRLLLRLRVLVAHRLL